MVLKWDRKFKILGFAMVRIIAGTAKGRKLETPEGLDTRPTLDRVKEAAFGSLQFLIPYSSVLDLFSGSGSLGLEAASRGAGQVILNDRNPKCSELIRRNASLCGLQDKVRVLNLDYLAAIDLLEKEGQSFDIVFLDAPYKDGTAQIACEELFRRKMIRENGTVLIEFGTELEPPHGVPGLMRIRKTKHYGACSFSLLEGDSEL